MPRAVSIAFAGIVSGQAYTLDRDCALIAARGKMVISGDPNLTYTSAATPGAAANDTSVIFLDSAGNSCIQIPAVGFSKGDVIFLSTSAALTAMLWFDV